MKRKTAIIAGVFVILIGALTLYVSGYMPGPIRRDANGFTHGMGWRRYHYDAGSLMLEEHYVAGGLELSRWFRPDGTLIAETHWHHGDGIGYYLRQDGTIRVKMEFRDGRAEGRAVH